MEFLIHVILFCMALILVPATIMVYGVIASVIKDAIDEGGGL